MQQLSEMDCTFLQQESPRTPMHISPVIVYDQSNVKRGPVRYKEILDVFRNSLHKSTLFRRKLAGGAGGLDAPYWVEDPHFDLEFHVRHIALPKPGDWRQFCILLARLQSRGLDMTRPLWEAYVIEGLNGVEGLPDKSFAIMLKVHHAAIDGVSGAEIVTAIHSLSDQLEDAEVVDTWESEPNPSSWHIWSRAYAHNLKRPVTFFQKARQLVPAVIRANKSKENVEATDKTPMVRTRFNDRVTAARVTDAIIIDLDTIKAIRREVGQVTVNDVVVSIVGGAMRRYLASKDELPDTSLSCGAPVSLRNERNSESTGNQVSNITISMATDIEDPVERLLAVHRSSEEAKAYASELGTSVLMDVSEVMIPLLLGWGMQAVTFAGAGAQVPVPSHTIISNVPGPQMPLYLAGARVHLMMGMGPLLHMMGLFHAVLSGAGKVTINFTCCREML
ncbi:MAG: wax ester/triacylglycerol synthase family O-acyltransferase, partial [Halioglobus sp.]